MTRQRYVSDELTHFVGRGLDETAQFELLVRVLREGRLTPLPDRSGPSWAVRVDKEEPLSGNRAYEPRVVCFSDIPVGDLDLHIRKNSPFGLAFRKPFCVERGANPVFYVAAASRSFVGGPRGEAFDEMARVFHKARADAQRRGDDEMLALARFLDMEVLSFLKFFEYPLDDEDPENYYMEREWRLHGELRFDVHDVRRVFFPEAYAQRFRKEMPEYAGQVVFARAPAEDG